MIKEPLYNIVSPSLHTGGTFHRISPRASPPRMDDESEPGTRSACDDKLKLDYIIASNNDIAKAIPSAVVHNREIREN